MSRADFSPLDVYSSHKLHIIQRRLRTTCKRLFAILLRMLRTYLSTVKTLLSNYREYLALTGHQLFVKIIVLAADNKKECNNVTKKSQIIMSKPTIKSDLYQGLFPIYHLSKATGLLPVRFTYQTTGRYLGRIHLIDIIFR